METRDCIIRRVCKTMSYQDVLDDIMARSEAEYERLDTDRLDRAEAKRIAQGWARATAAPIKQEASMKLADATKAKMIERRAAGESINSIAKDLKVSWDTVRNAVEPNRVEPVAPEPKQTTPTKPSAWNAHMCGDTPGEDIIIRLDDGEPYILTQDARRIGPINLCPWCGARLGENA